MHTLKNFLIITAISSLTILTFSCNNNNATKTVKETTRNNKEYDSTYICPMHCKGSGSETPGECPVCGMKYIKNPN